MSTQRPTSALAKDEVAVQAREPGYTYVGSTPSRGNQNESYKNRDALWTGGGNTQVPQRLQDRASEAGGRGRQEGSENAGQGAGSNGGGDGGEDGGGDDNRRENRSTTIEEAQDKEQRLLDLMRQMDELDAQWERITNVTNIVRSFRENVKQIERELPNPQPAQSSQPSSELRDKAQTEGLLLLNPESLRSLSTYFDNIMSRIGTRLETLQRGVERETV